MNNFIKTISNLYLNKWITKKSRNPFGKNFKPCLFIKKITHDRRTNKTYFRIGKNSIQINKQLLNQIEIIDKKEAQFLNKIYYESGFLTDCISETEMHVRKDTGENKKCFEKDGFQIALYYLKKKFPLYKCTAYNCLVCGKIHLGKVLTMHPICLQEIY